jgi:hypothetical protein
MIWVMLRGIERPHFWVRATVDLAIIVGVAAPLTYLAAFDHDPPWDEARGTAEKTEIARGDTQEIGWNTVERRYCREVSIRRSLISDDDQNWVSLLAEVRVVMDPDLPRPVLKRGSSPPFQIPMRTPLGKTFYRGRLQLAAGVATRALAHPRDAAGRIVPSDRTAGTARRR